MMTFDYTASAELFVPKKGKAGARQPVSYRRFATAAEAFSRHSHASCMDAGGR
jgi:hypothetical protein